MYTVLCDSKKSKMIVCFDDGKLTLVLFNSLFVCLQLFKKSKKDKDHLSPNLDTESVISGRSSTRGLRRTLSAKRKTP